MFPTTNQKNDSDIIVSIKIALIFICVELYGSKYIGFLSVRHLVLLVTVFSLVFSKNLSHGSNRKSILFNSLLLYYIFISVLGIFNGLYDDVGYKLVFARLLPSSIIFIYIYKHVDNIRTYKTVIYVFLLFVILDALVTILQGIGNPIGWAISSFFPNYDASEDIVVGETSIGISSARGVMGSVVANGFFLTSCGLFFWMPGYLSRKKWAKFISAFIWIISLIALFYNQQRVAFYTFVIFSAFILIYFVITSKKAWLIIPVILFASVCLFSFYSNQLGTENLDLGRLSKVSSGDITERHLRHKLFYTHFFPNNWLLGNRLLWSQTYGRTPHNVIIETLLLGGVGGLLLFLRFVCIHIYACYKFVIAKKGIFLIASLPIISILCISWEHSSGLHTGFTLSIYPLVLYDSFCNSKT